MLLHFFGQRFVDHRLRKDLERYRVEFAEKTEALKTQLSIFAHEQNVAASRVDAQGSQEGRDAVCTPQANSETGSTAVARFERCHR